MPDLWYFAGPNGAGKTTIALKALPALGVRHFVNADLIAAGLSPLDPTLTALRSGRLMLERLNTLVEAQESFGVEGTLAARSVAPFLQRCRDQGYRINMIFVWLQSPDLCVARVAARVRAGGHDVPGETIRRRYQAGRRNFVDWTQNWLVGDKFIHRWMLLDNTDSAIKIAEGTPSVMYFYDKEMYWRFAGNSDARF